MCQVTNSSKAEVEQMDVVEINFYAAQWWREFDIQRQLAGMTMMTDKPPFPPLHVTSALESSDNGLV